MKTLEQLYNEVMASDTLKAEFLEAAKTKDSIKAFLEKYGCDAEWDAFIAFMKEKSDRELSKEDLASVSGGKLNAGGVTLSLISAGAICIFGVAFTAILEYDSLDECINLPEYDSP